MNFNFYFILFLVLNLTLDRLCNRKTRLHRHHKVRIDLGLLGGKTSSPFGGRVILLFPPP